MIKVILLRAPCQNVNVLLSVKQSTIAVNSVINWSFFLIFAVFLYFQAILSIQNVAWQYVISSQQEDWTRDVIEHVTIRLAIGH